MSPPVPLGAKDTLVCVPLIWVDVTPTGVHKDNETSSGEAETDSHSSDCILRRHTDHTPDKGWNFVDHSPGMLDVRNTGIDGWHGEISTYSTAGTRVPGVPGELIFPSPGIPNRENEEDTAEFLHQQQVLIRDITRFMGKASASARAIWQPLLHYRVLQCIMNSVALMDPIPCNQDDQVRCQPEPHQGSQDGPVLVDFPKSGLSDDVSPCALTPDITIKSDASNTGWRARQREAQTGGMWSKKESLNHINYLE